MLAIFGSVGSPIVNAAASEEVLRDLRHDKNFNEADYPYVKDDYGLYVIQIAESSNKELFVYVYQPCNDTYDLVGTKISISYGYSVDGAGLSPKLYNLKLLSTSGTLDKYYVDGFTIPNDGDRYYNIVEIFRMANSDIDEVDESFPKTDIAYSVGQQWYVFDLNDSKYYEMNTFNTLYVDTVFNSSLAFHNGLQLRNLIGVYPSCHCWFYCFNVADYVIDHIYDADLNYSVKDGYQTVGLGSSGDFKVTDQRTNQVITLKDTDVMTYTASGFGGRSFKWNRILSSKEFVETAEKQDVKFVESDKEKILSSQWVFTFLETKLETHASEYYVTTYYSDVYDVGLLRLSFQDISGKKYNLGVVNDLTDPDNIVSGSFDPDIIGTLEKIFKVVLLILAVLLILFLLSLVAPLGSIVKFLFKAIIYIISLPFRLVKWVFSSHKKKDG